MADDLLWQPAHRLCEQIRRRALGCRELLDRFLQRIEETHADINAVVTLDVEGARARAEDADRALARGLTWGPLHGLPMTVKDSFEVTGMTTTCGAEQLRNHVPQTNAVAVQRLIDAGAVVFGKTNLPFMAGDFQSFNDLFGTTNNPWDTSRTPGGSSGGAAAALAAGMTPLELGSDIGGSIRNPAHYCGVFGLKPSYGLVSMRGHIPGPPGTQSRADLAVAGPMARTVADLELALDLLVAPEPTDQKAWRLELPEPRARSLTDFRIGLWFREARAPIDDAIATVLDDAVTRIRAAGGTITDEKCSLNDPGKAREIYLLLLYAIMANGFPSQVLQRLDQGAASLAEDDTSFRALMMRGVSLRHRDWARVHERRERLRAEWARVFRDIDVLLCPIMPTAAFAHDHRKLEERTIAINGQPFPYLEQSFWAGLASAAWLPAAVVPCGHTGSGLPVGIQVIGPYLEDRTVLAFARELERVLGGFRVPKGY